MRFPVTSALRAELRRARASASEDRLALFVLGLGDEGDLPAWEVASELMPEDAPAPGEEPSRTLLIGAAPLAKLVHTLSRAGELELSAALHASPSSVPVLLLQDVVRVVTALDAVEAEEAEALLAEAIVAHA